jgi:hypothetical protein
LSTPPEIWPLIPPFGKPWYSGVLHDAAYRQYLQILCEDDSWKDVVLTQEQADCLIDEAMESQGVEDVERDAIFRALESFGNKAFAQDAIDATARKASQGGLTPAATQ